MKRLYLVTILCLSLPLTIACGETDADPGDTKSAAGGLSEPPSDLREKASLSDERGDDAVTGKTEEQDGAGESDLDEDPADSVDVGAEEALEDAREDVDPEPSGSDEDELDGDSTDTDVAPASADSGNESASAGSEDESASAESDTDSGPVKPPGRCPGKGSGTVTFAEQPVDVSGGSFKGPSAIAVGDLNGDQLPDVGVFGGDSSKAEWYASPAELSGTWRRHVLKSLPVARKFLGASKIADLDGDGNNDIIVSIDNHSNAEMSAYVYWWKNPGPSEAEQRPWEVHAIGEALAVHHINDMEVVDLDEDGQLDVVVRSLTPNQLLLFFHDNADEWTLRTLDASPYGARGEGFSVGNIDATNGPDLTICGYWLAAPADPRTGPFAAHVINAAYSTINANTKEAVGDINGDGHLDVLISPAEGGRGGENHVLAWYQAPADPARSGWQEHVIMPDFNAAHTVKLADMDNDGDLDVISGVAWSRWGQPLAIRVFYNDGRGGFPDVQLVAQGSGLYSGVVADLESDGDLDIIGQGAFTSASRPDVYRSQLCD